MASDKRNAPQPSQPAPETPVEEKRDALETVVKALEPLDDASRRSIVLSLISRFDL